MKKVLTVVLSVLFLISVGMFVGCSIGGNSDTDFEAKFKEGVKTTVSINQAIDFNDYIVKVEGSTYKITVTYTIHELEDEKTKTEEFTGFNTMFYPKEEGEVKVLYEVSVGKKTKSAELTINIVMDNPTVLFSENAQTVVLDKKTDKYTISYINLMKLVNMRVKPLGSIPSITKIGYSEYVIGQELKDYTFTDEEFDKNSSAYTFNKAGMYKFSACLENETGKAERDFYIFSVAGSATSYKSKVINDQTNEILLDKGSVQMSRYGNKTDFAYYSMGDYSVGDTIEIDFKGVNIPNVAFLTDSPNGQAIGGGQGYYAQFCTEYAGTNTGIGNRFYLSGDNRAETGSTKDYSDYASDVIGKNGNISGSAHAISNDVVSPLSWNSFDSDGDYKLFISTSMDSERSLTINIELKKKNAQGDYELIEIPYGQGRSLISTYTKSGIRVLDTAWLYNRYAICYGNSKKQIQFNYKITKYSGVEDIYKEVKNYNSKINDDGNIELIARVDDQSIDAGYIGLGEFEIGSVATFNFKGQNIPNIALFTEKFCEELTSGKGVYIQTSSKTDALSHSIAIYGPNKIGSSVDNYETENQKAIFGESKFGLLNLDVDYTYKYEIKTDKSDIDADENVKFICSLYQVNKKTTTLLETRTFDIQCDKENIYMIAYSAYGKNVEFNYSVEKGEGTNIGYNAIQNIDGSITLKKGKEYHKNTDSYTDWSYINIGEIDTDKMYQFNFTGKNIPNLGIMMDSEGQAISAGGKGYVAIATQQTGNGTTPAKRFYMAGPSRIVPSIDDTYLKDSLTVSGDAQGALVSSTGNNTDKMSYDDLIAGTKYVYTVMFTKKTNGSVVLDLSLKTASGEIVRNITTTLTDDYAKSCFNDGDDPCYMIVFGNAIQDISLRYQVVDKPAVPTEYKATKNVNGTITLGAGGYAPNLQGASSDFGYIGLGEYKSGDALAFYFTGKNIPNVALYTDSLGGQAVGGGTGIFIQTSSFDASWNRRTNILGKYRLESGNPADYASYGADHGGKNAQARTEYTTIADAIAYGNLEDGVEYCYYITSTVNNGSVVIKLTLYKKVNSKYEVVKTWTANASAYGLDATYFNGTLYAIAYGSIKSDITFKYEYVEEQAVGYNTKFNKITEEYYMPKGTITTSSDGNSSNLSYLGLGEYKVGDTLTFEFTGLNIPNVAIFTDSEEGQAIGGGTGIYIQTSSQDASWKNRTQISAPHRLETGNPNDYGTYNTEPGLKVEQKAYDTSADAIAVNHLVAGVKYRYTISTQITATFADSFNISITLKLEKYEGSEWVLVKEFNSTRNDFHIIDIENCYAIAYGSSIVDTSFSYTKTEAENFMATKDDSNNITVQKGITVMSDAGNKTLWGHYGLGEYEVGDTLTFEFTGKNIPNVALFTDSEEGQAIGGGTGYMIINTNIPAYLTRWYVSGPNRIETGNVDDYGTYNKDALGKNEQIAEVGGSNTKMEYASLTDGVQYKLVITTALNGTTLTLTATIYSRADAGSDYVQVNSRATNITGFNTEWATNHYAIAYGNSSANATFTYTITKG